MAGEKDRKNRLQKLSDSDFEIADGQPDIRGWNVKNESGKKIGEVDELIFDEQSRKVRYLVLDVNGNELDMDDRTVLVPIGIAELHKDDDDVILPAVTAKQLQALPEYSEDRFDSDHEMSTRDVFGGLGATALTGAAGGDFYDHPSYNDDNLYRNRRKATSEEDDATIPVIKEELNIGKREVETGGVRLRSRVVENEVSKDINLRQETVRIERNLVDRNATEDDFVEAEMEEREYDEVPVVNKEARVVEEISLSKDVNEREETVRDSVRNTEVDIDGIQGNNKNVEDSRSSL